MRTACALLCATFLIFAVYPLDARAQPNPSVSAQVGQRFDQAQAAFAKGDMQGAYEAYTAAWALQKSYDIAGNLGNVEAKLSKFRDAAEHLAFSVENFPPTGKEALQKAIQNKLAEVLKEIGRLHIQVTASGARVDGASVTVNGRPVGTAPIAGTLFVEPGPIVVEVRLTGYLDGRQQVVIAKGGEQSVTITLAAAGPNNAIVIAGAAVTGVAAVSGVVLAVLAGVKGSDADAAQAKLPAAGANVCPANATLCATIHSDRQAHDAFAKGTIGAFAGAGVIGVATLGYALLLPKRSPTTGLRVVPMVGTNSAGMAVVGVWR
jgi:hypothetical protein